MVAAELAFATVGYGAAKLADIANRAGIRRPSLLYHFGTKEALYERTVARCFERLSAALTETMSAEGEFVQRIDRTVARYVEFLDAEPQLARIVLRELLDENGPGRPILLRQLAPLLDTVERFIEVHGEGQVPPELPVRAVVMQIGSGALLRAAAGSLRDPLWGAVDHSRDLARRLLLRDPPPCSTSTARSPS